MLSKITSPFNNFNASAISKPVEVNKSNSSCALLPKLTQDTFVRNNIISFGSQQSEQKIMAALSQLKSTLDPNEVNPKIVDEIITNIKAGNAKKAEILLNEVKSSIKGNIIIISGPSGVGKDTVINELLTKDQDLKTIVSHTTRLPREKDGERDGVSYYFIQGKDNEEKAEKFKALIPDMLQWAKLGNFYYGSTKTELENKQKGHDVCLNVYAKDAVRLKKELGDKVVTIFIEPGEANEKANLDELSRRILARNPMGTEELNDRLVKAKEQLALKDQFDFTVKNPRDVNRKATLAANDATNDILSRRNPAFKMIDDIKAELTKLYPDNSEKKSVN